MYVIITLEYSLREKILRELLKISSRNRKYILLRTLTQKAYLKSNTALYPLRLFNLNDAALADMHQYK